MGDGRDVSNNSVDGSETTLNLQSDLGVAAPEPAPAPAPFAPCRVVCVVGSLARPSIAHHLAPCFPARCPVIELCQLFQLCPCPCVSPSHRDPLAAGSPLDSSRSIGQIASESEDPSSLPPASISSRPRPRTRPQTADELPLSTRANHGGLSERPSGPGCRQSTPLARS